MPAGHRVFRQRVEFREKLEAILGQSDSTTARMARWLTAAASSHMRFILLSKHRTLTEDEQRQWRQVERRIIHALGTCRIPMAAWFNRSAGGASECSCFMVVQETNTNGEVSGTTKIAIPHCHTISGVKVAEIQVANREKRKQQQQQQQQQKEKQT